jgi:hypothetical protein
MKRVLILFALVLSAFVAGCETIPKYNFPCTYRAYDAGYCSTTNLTGRPPGF